MFTKKGNILYFDRDTAPIIKTAQGKAKIFKIDLSETLEDPDRSDIGQRVVYCVISEKRYDIHNAYGGYWNRKYILKLIDKDNTLCLLD